MARWVAIEGGSSGAGWTPAAVADTTNFTNTNFMALQGGSSTQRINVLEVYMGGLAGSSAPMPMIIGRDSTVGGTLSVGQFNALDGATAALGAPPVCFNTATTKPQRSSSGYLLGLGFNAFGGIVRYVYAPGEEVGMLGNTASLGEISLSQGNTGTSGLMISHFICEPF